VNAIAGTVPLGVADCPFCRAAIVWAMTSDSGRLLCVDFEPTSDLGAAGLVELYIEHFPSGDLVDGVQRVRLRPLDRSPRSPAWLPHACLPRGEEP
jgi:hypothetical protein